MKLAAPLAYAASLLTSGCFIDPFCLNCKDHVGEADGGADTGQREVGPWDGPDYGDCNYVGDEVCNGADDNCNGEIDEGVLPEVGGFCGTEQGVCSPGTMACVDGELVCANGYVAPTPEMCNGIDDDCDGVADNGNPGGLASCETSAGECRAGTTACLEGRVQCVGAVFGSVEVCDGLDNDCDGVIDNGNPGGGTCEDTGAVCTAGMLRCAGADGLPHYVCVHPTGPTAEECDNFDNDCDGDVDEDFDFDNDVNHCGSCSTACGAPHARVQCTTRVCSIAACDDGYVDANGLYADGCEYPCAYQGEEVCNGLDDDCSGRWEQPGELEAPPDLCLVENECRDAEVRCDGVDGWRCHYGSTVSTDPSGDIIIIPEIGCDNKDNDCNGIEDDEFPTKGDPCTRGLGACMTTGHYVCNGAEDNITCDAQVPPAGTPEVCDGIDNDCNGLVDDDAPDYWVPIGGGVEIYQYEASRPDATKTAQGVLSHRSCSAPDRLPWTNVNHPQAEAACAAAGARLCTEAEWQSACESSTGACRWSFANGCDAYADNACNGNDWDSDDTRPGDQDRLYPTGDTDPMAPFGVCRSDWGIPLNITDDVFDLSGNAKEWTQERSPGVNPLRGGSYNNSAGGLRCDFDFVVANDTFLFANVGFRCCRGP